MSNRETARQELVAIGDLLDTLWGLAQGSVEDPYQLELIKAQLVEIDEKLQLVGQIVADLNDLYLNAKGVAQKSTAALTRTRMDMQNWEHASEPRVQELVNQVRDKTWEEEKESLEWLLKMQLEENIRMRMYEALDGIDEFWPRQQLAANVAGWLANVDLQALTVGQRQALQHLAEELNGVWLGEVPE